ncbi:MAG: nuclease-related domain-containing protein [Sporichthyaceae bacterium]
MKTLNLRRADTCNDCRTDLPAGTKAAWDPAARAVRCLNCAEPGDTTPRVPASRAEPSPPNVAGASARREFERRSRKREAEIRARHPRIGGFLVAIGDDPSHTKVWAQGAEGERKVASTLDALEGVVALHDRRLRRGSNANIDHIAITPNGIWVVDAKTHRGKLEVRREGGLFTPRTSRLYIHGRDQTTLVEGVARQVGVVRDAVAAAAFDLEVRGALCFVGTELPWSAVSIDGIPLIGRRALGKLLAQPGSADAQTVAEVAAWAAAAFPPA